MTDEIEWPREIWLAELDQHHNGQAHAALSEHATVPRWEGDEERDREFHMYVDADIHDSAERYQTERLRIALERAEKAENELALVTAQLEAAQEAFPAQPGLMRQRMAERKAELSGLGRDEANRKLAIMWLETSRELQQVLRKLDSVPGITVAEHVGEDGSLAPYLPNSAAVINKKDAKA
ncbi:hypothetical protein [Roseovarius pacificus]|uniref:hypothetical protein n=1 Tax=Roseovarius pacificus TaxID=337701 RepID=UPI0040397A00